MGRNWIVMHHFSHAFSCADGHCHLHFRDERREARWGWLGCPKFNSSAVEETGRDSTKVRLRKVGPFCCTPLPSVDWTAVDFKTGRSAFETVKRFLCSWGGAGVLCDQHFALFLSVIHGFCLPAWLFICSRSTERVLAVIEMLVHAAKMVLPWSFSLGIFLPVPQM